MKFHPDVTAAHAEFGGDLELMQKCYEYPDLKSEVVRLRAVVQEAEPYIETLHSLMAKSDTRAAVWAVIKRMRAALASTETAPYPADGGENGT